MDLRRAAQWCAALALCLTAGPLAAQDAPGFRVELQTPLTHDGGDFLWFHPRAAVVPGDSPLIVLTLQKHLKQSDYYSGLHAMYSRDLGATWSDPVLPLELDWRRESADVIEAVCDVTPGWHAPSGKVLAIGVKVRYRDGVQLLDRAQSHAAAYAVFDPATMRWTAWRFVEMPDPAGKFFLTTPGCVQWLVEPDGTLLVPVYFAEREGAPFRVTVLRCAFDGETLRYLGHGDELALNVERGLAEPSLTKFLGRYYLTLRNDVKGYVTTSADGQHFAAIRPWTFDDGTELGSYNTQQHWVTHSEGLYLVYTRRGANNDHIPRSRAPLFIAQVDSESLRVIRATERIVIPEKGAMLGNFGVCAVGAGETWVTDSEYVTNDDARARGASGATYIARIRWDRPNALAKE